MIIDKKGYSYNDLTIVPEVISTVSSRSECNPFIENKQLPIFTAPMASVVNENNLKDFKNNRITPILPRNIDFEIRKQYLYSQTWVAFSLNEFKQLFIDSIEEKSNHYYVVVDIANGHMMSLYNICKKAKEIASKNDYELTIMTGNIANPETYRYISENCTYIDNNNKTKCVIDYIRIGIGGGSGCITTSNVSIHYPQATLIDECYRIKQELKTTLRLVESTNILKPTTKYEYEMPKIVADGGIRNYDHVIKALALGADYVMIGSVFSQCVESAGEKEVRQENRNHHQLTNCKDFLLDNEENWWAIKNDSNKRQFIGQIYVKFFGMASADGQKSINGVKTKTAEGITKYLKVIYSLNGWTDNMISYLQSAMSYTNCRTLSEFIGHPKLIINSISEIRAVNK